MVNDRVVKGMKTLNSMRSVIACVSIPIDIRIRAIRAILIPVLSYGGELWGMSEERSAAPQRMLTFLGKPLEPTPITMVWQTLLTKFSLKKTRIKGLINFTTVSEAVIREGSGGSPSGMEGVQ
jgi:hypothetical protein